MGAESHRSADPAGVRAAPHALGLAVFRISFSLVLLAEVVQLLRFRHLIFDPVPFLEPIRISVGALLVLWALSLVALALGILTRPAALVSYAFAVIVLGFSVGHGYSYHADTFYLLGSLLLVFMPCDRVLSLAGWRRAPPAAVEVSGGYTLALQVVLAAIYLDSFTWKIASPMWRAGLGVWVPVSQVFATYRDASALASPELFTRLLGYAVLAFEGLFPLLIWGRRSRAPLLIAGIALHAGLLFVFPIPLFSLVVISFYLGLLPSALARARPVERDPAPAPRSVRAFIAAWTLCSLLMLLQSPLWAPSALSTGQGRLARLYYRANDILYGLAGVQPHGVFDDTYFRDYDRQILLVFEHDGVETVLPYTDGEGFTGPYLSGRVYSMWTWFTLAPKRDSASLGRELSRYVTFWAVREGVDLERGRVSIRRRSLFLSLTQWKPDWLRRNQMQPWSEVGRIRGAARALEVSWDAPG
jgi:hypothetical protein